MLELVVNISQEPWQTDFKRLLYDAFGAIVMKEQLQVPQLVALLSHEKFKVPTNYFF